MPNAVFATDYSSASTVSTVVPATVTTVPEFGLNIVFRLTAGAAVVNLLGDGAIIRTISFPLTGERLNEMADSFPLLGSYTTWGWSIQSISGGGTVFCTAAPIFRDDVITAKALKGYKLMPAGIADAARSQVAGAGIGVPLMLAKTNVNASISSLNAGGDGTARTIASFVVPGGSMGPNGTLNVEIEIGNNSNATNAAFKLMIGANDISAEPTLAAAAANFWNATFCLENTAVAAQRYRGSVVKQGTSTAGFVVPPSVDTSADFTVLVTGRWGSASVVGGTITLYKLRAWVEYGA